MAPVAERYGTATAASAMSPPETPLAMRSAASKRRARSVLSAKGARSKYPLRWESVPVFPFTRTFSRWNFPGPFATAGSNASR